MEKKIKYTLAILSIILICLSYNNFGFLFWIAFVPLIIFTRQASRKEILVFAPIASICIGFVMGFWIRHYDFRTTVLAIVFFSFYFLCFIFFTRFLLKKIQEPYSVLIPPIVWLGLYFVSLLTPANGFWFDLSGFFNSGPMFAPLIGIVKGFGITFLMILLNSIIAFYILRRNKIILITGIGIIMLLTGCFIYSNYSEPQGDKLRVALIQGNFQQDWNWRRKHAETTILETYKKLSLKAAEQKPDLVVWPEYAIPIDVLSNEELLASISSLAKEMNANLVLGTFVLDFFIDDNVPRAETRNRALVFDRQGNLLGTYDAMKPFPFSKQAVPGDSAEVFQTDIGRFGISTWNEELDNFVYRQYIDSGVDFFVSIANEQHIKSNRWRSLRGIQAALRASENNKYLIRATNGGLTQVVNPYGKVIKKLETLKEGILIADIYK